MNLGYVRWGDEVYFWWRCQGRGPWLFGQRRFQGGRACVFGWRLIHNEDVDTIERQRIFGEAGAGRTRFRVIEFAVLIVQPMGQNLILFLWWIPHQ